MDPLAHATKRNFLRRRRRRRTMANRQKLAKASSRDPGTMFLVGQRGRKAVRLGEARPQGCEEEKEEEEEFDQRVEAAQQFEDETLERFSWYRPAMTCFDDRAA